MTLKEKVAEMEPKKVDIYFGGGVKGCPGGYDYLNDGAGKSAPCACEGDCWTCWNREFVPVEKEEMKKRSKQAHRSHQNALSDRPSFSLQSGRR